MTKAEQPTIDSIIQDICELDNNPFDGMGDDDVWCSLSDLRVILERNFEDHRTTSLAAQEPVAMRYDFDGFGWQYIDSGSGSDWQTRHPDAEPLYTAQDGLVEALRAQHDAEMARNECEECEGEGDWVECSVCSLAFGNAIDLRHAALSALGDKP